ncbi:hypothetical protein [Sulfurimonas sp. HSL-1716]|uniref:hypothetical protein n=1 Tax=Hydrocurvibacter sulfurireducens TaxID=3131937 RepID=UPI0031F73139
MQKHQIIINERSIQEHAFSLQLNGVNVFVRRVPNASIESVVIRPYLFYNAVDLKQVSSDKMMFSFAAEKIEKLEMYQSIFNPLSLHLEAHGSFGTLEGKFSLLNRHLFLLLTPSKLLLQNRSDLLRNFVKNQKGEYVYEKNI